MTAPQRPTPERLDEISEDYASLPVLGTDHTPEDWHRHCVISGRLIAVIPALVAEIRRLSAQGSARMTTERLDEIDALMEEATPGPWWVEEDDHTWTLHGIMFQIPAHDGFRARTVNRQILKAPKQGTPYAEYWPDAADARLITQALPALTELMVEVRYLRGENAMLSERDRELSRLEAAGVGNWEGYSQAFADDEDDEDGED